MAGGIITAEEALESALKHVKLRRDQVDFIDEIELDYEHGTQVYEVSFNKGGFEFEFDINAENGRILKFKKERD